MLTLFIIAACAVQDTNNDSSNGVHLCAADERNVICTEQYDPVCSTTSNGEQTYPNACHACSDPDVISHTPGECAQEMPTDGLLGCPAEFQDTDICTMDYNPVCITFADGSQETAGNLCMGCSQDREILGYTQGECAGEITDGEMKPEVQMIMCDTENRPQACTREYNPVCGSVDTGVRCITKPCPSQEFTTFGNACDACANEDVYGHYAGSCEEQKFVVCAETVTGFSAEEHAERIGGICVDECPQGFDEYMTQIGVEMCIVAYDEQTISAWETCTQSSNSCNCVKAYETTGDEQIDDAQYRCVPDQYAERLLFRGGQDRLDENGEQGVMIA